HGFQCFQLGRCETFRVVNISVGVGRADDATTELHNLVNRVLRHVARSRDQASLVIERLSGTLKHVGGEVYQSVAGCLGADKTSSPTNALTRENTREFVLDLLVSTKQVTDLAFAHADIACGNVKPVIDVTGQLTHE